MKLNVEIDTSNLKAKGARLQKHLAYSAAQALNDTVLDAQIAERANLDRKFTVRKNAFFYRLVKIKFANVKQDRAYAELYIDDTKPRLLLSRFEKGGTKKPTAGKSVAVPITGGPARPQFRDPVARKFQFKQIGLRLYRTKSGVRQWKGKNRTFLIPNLGVFQRTKAKAQKTTLRLLYRLKPSPLLKATLEFVKVARAEFLQRWQVNFQRRFKGGA